MSNGRLTEEPWVQPPCLCPWNHVARPPGSAVGSGKRKGKKVCAAGPAQHP